MRKVRFKDLQDKKANKKPIVCLTAYDYSFAKLLDCCDLDVILVGDSLSNVFAGYETTLSITLQEMIYHAKAVRRAVKNALLVMDMPFLSYEVNPDQGVMNAGRVIQETQVDAVKLECKDEKVLETMERIVGIGVPVMGHIGFMPQAVRRLGGFFVQGTCEKDQKELKTLAKRCQDAGAFALVLEMIPKQLAYQITESIQIPTIGIGAGQYCDGQIVVSYDILGMNQHFKPKFLRRYADFDIQIQKAVNAFCQDVKLRDYPNNEESY